MPCGISLSGSANTTGHLNPAACNEVRLRAIVGSVLGAVVTPTAHRNGSLSKRARLSRGRGHLAIGHVSLWTARHPHRFGDLEHSTFNPLLPPKWTQVSQMDSRSFTTTRSRSGRRAISGWSGEDSLTTSQYARCSVSTTASVWPSASLLVPIRDSPSLSRTSGPWSNCKWWRSNLEWVNDRCASRVFATEVLEE